MLKFKYINNILILCFSLLLFSCTSSSSNSEDDKIALADIKTWMYQIQDLNDEVRLAALAETEYRLLVIEPGFNFTEFPYDTAHIMQQLRYTPSGKRRIILAYIDIGQAEDYRDYWQPDWVAPTATTVGSPAYLLAPDPDNWSGNYQVAYWKTEWKDLWTGSNGIIEKLADFQFDGIYMDWVEAWDDTSVQTAATVDGVNVASEMMSFIEEMRATGKAKNSNFYVVPQNAPYLIDEDPTRYAAMIDALAVEDTWFHGDGDVLWDSERAGDLTERHQIAGWSTAERLAQYENYISLGIPVFSVDYCVNSSNATQVYSDALAAGLIPLVTQVPLDRLTDNPPAGH